MKLVIKGGAFLIMASLVGCIGPGTQGSLESYHYKVPKDSLQRAINSVISATPTIYKDTAKRYSFIDVTEGKNDTVWDTYYQDGLTYETICIEVENDRITYVFRYSGDDEFWKTSGESEIFICYAHDGKGNSGSERSGKMTSQARARFVGFFEDELIERINKNGVQ